MPTLPAERLLLNSISAWKFFLLTFAFLPQYGVFIIILLVLEIVVFSFAIIYKDVVSLNNRINFSQLFSNSNWQAKDETQNFLKATIREYKSSATEADGPTLMWNTLMGRLECCGVSSYNDFDTSSYWQTNKSSRVVPEACCKLSDKTLLKPVDNNCPYSPSDSNSYYMKVSGDSLSEWSKVSSFFCQGCYDSLINYLDFNKNLVIGVSSGLILIQLFAAFLAFCLCKCIGRYRSSSRL